jgi:hypothetical protein
VTLIAVDILPVAGAVQADIVSEIRKVLERCIHPAQDMLLPSMSDAEPVETFFLVACTDARGFNVIARRIGRELQTFDNSSKLKPIISSTTLLIAPSESSDMQVREITVRIEQLVQAHLLDKEPLK